MAQSIRAFIAAEISGEIHACAKKAIERLSQCNADIQWASLDQMHLTIKFLGEVDFTGLSQVCRSLEKAVAGIEPIEVECGGIGAFPRPDRPRTLWLGINDRDNRLSHLATVVEDAMAAIRFRREHRPFRPHLTLGRLRSQNGAVADAIESGDFTANGRLVIDELILFSSELTKNGPVHRPVGRVGLDG